MIASIIRHHKGDYNMISRLVDVPIAFALIRSR